MLEENEMPEEELSSMLLADLIASMKRLEELPSEVLEVEGLELAKSVLDVITSLKTLSNSCIQTVRTIMLALSPNDREALVKHSLADDPTEKGVQAKLEEISSLYSHRICKVCKITPADWWAHGMDEECTDTECIEDNHDAMCNPCQNEMLRVHSELNFRNN
jgi:hypothetical protein